MADDNGDYSGWLGLLGGLVSSAGSVYANHQNLKASKSRWSKSVALSNTAHQREVADLRAAGLNPVLSADGSGASVPSLGVAEQTNPLEGLGDGVSSASKYASSQYRENVKQLRLANDGQKIDNSAARLERDMLKKQNYLDTLSKGVETVQQAAELEALTGRPYEGLRYIMDWDKKEVRENYERMVQMVRRRIESGNYSAQWERELLGDVSTGVDTVANGVSAARGIQSMKKTAPRRRVKRGWKRKGSYYEEEETN